MAHTIIIFDAYSVFYVCSKFCPCGMNVHNLKSIIICSIVSLLAKLFLFSTIAPLPQSSYACSHLCKPLLFVIPHNCVYITLRFERLFRKTTYSMSNVHVSSTERFANVSCAGSGFSRVETRLYKSSDVT